MDMATLAIGSDRNTAAKNIRAELKEAYPGVAFSVRSQSFTGGSAIDVSWTDGPTAAQVEKIVGKYQCGNFDGMTDSYEYRRGGWTDHHGGAKYVHTRRDQSAALVARAIAQLVEKYGAHDVPTTEDYKAGRAWTTTPLGGKPEMHYWCWQSLISRELAKTPA